MDDQIYDRPRDYDLEHEDDDEDVRFYVELVRRLAPRRLLELGAGSGRVTVPLAELAARAGFTVTALDSSDTMLAEAQRKLAQAAGPVRERVVVVQGDMRTWVAPEPFDLIVVPCSSVCHLLGLDARWSRSTATRPMRKGAGWCAIALPFTRRSSSGPASASCTTSSPRTITPIAG